MRALDTGDGQRAQAHIHRRMCVRIHIRHIDGADFMMEIARNLLNELHDALITLESSGIAFGCKHCNLAGAEKVGMEIARLAKEKNITQVVFDRNGYLYHGRVKAVADGAREGGLEF